MGAVAADIVKRAPKALLHDHLDGGLRPQTIIELAAASGYDGLPADRRRGARALVPGQRRLGFAGALPRDVQPHRRRDADPDELRRVARECAVDLAADGVVYAESRFAPELHAEKGLALTEVVEAVLEGLREGEAEAAAAGTPIRMVSLLTAMRHAAKSDEIAELAVRYRHQGVGGFDIAGAEAGFPPSRHLSAFEYLRRENAHFTIHAGEAFGLPSIWEAIQWCGADRLGHGVRIVDDITTEGDTHTLGLLAAYVRDRRIPLEMAPTSNLQTGAAESIATHPITMLKDLRFRVTINTDNRLMSGTSMTREMQLLVDEAGWTLDDLRWATINAMKSAFIPFDERLAIIERVVKPGYAALSAAT